MDALNTNQFIWLSATWRSGRKKTEQENKIKTTINHRKKLSEQRKRSKEGKIVKKWQQLPYSIRRHLRICLQKVFNRKRLGKSAFQIHQLADIEYIAMITSLKIQIVENSDCVKKRRQPLHFYPTLPLNGSHFFEQPFYLRAWEREGTIVPWS